MNRKICNCFLGGFFIALVLFIGYMIGIGRMLLFPIYMVINLTYPSFLEPYAMHLGYIGIFILMFLNMFGQWSFSQSFIFAFRAGEMIVILHMVQTRKNRILMSIRNMMEYVLRLRIKIYRKLSTGSSGNSA